MSIAAFDTAIWDPFVLQRCLRWRDADIDATLMVSQPSADPDLWTEYAKGAQRSYRKHGVEHALDVDSLRSGADTIMFFVVIDDAGRMIAGVRAKALRSDDDRTPSLNGLDNPANRPSAT